MNEPKKPSMFWSVFWTVVGIGLPAFTSLMSFGNALMTERGGTVWIIMGVLFGGWTIYAVNGVYRGFAASNARWAGVLIPGITIGMIALVVAGMVLSHDALSLEIKNTGSIPIRVSHGGDNFEVGGGQSWYMRYSVGDRLQLLCWDESVKEQAKEVTLDREGPPVGGRPGPLKAEVTADGGEIRFRFVE